MRFEWDEGKNRINQAKHDGLDFETTARAFNDPQVLLSKDRIVEGDHDGTRLARSQGPS